MLIDDTISPYVNSSSGNVTTPPALAPLPSPHLWWSHRRAAANPANKHATPRNACVCVGKRSTERSRGREVERSRDRERERGLVSGYNFCIKLHVLCPPTCASAGSLPYRSVNASVRRAEGGRCRPEKRHKQTGLAHRQSSRNPRPRYRKEGKKTAVASWDLDSVRHNRRWRRAHKEEPACTWRFLVSGGRSVQ